MQLEVMYILFYTYNTNCLITHTYIFFLMLITLKVAKYKPKYVGERVKVNNKL